MKKIILGLFVCLFFGGFVQAQTYLKGNAAYMAFGIPNLSVETRISSHWTFSSELVYSPWESIQGNKFKFLQFNPDFRWYPSEAFKGFYTGGYLTLQDFKITKWNYLNRNRYQDGWGYGLGALLGFQTDISDRWNLDVYLGGGWHHGEYQGYHKGVMTVDWNGSGEFLPYRLGIAFAYRLK